MKTVLGLAIIAFGIFMEILWLGFCFGSVIIGILLLIFAPVVLFFPFSFFLVIGLTLISGKPRGNSFRYRSNFRSNTYNNSKYTLDDYYKTLESNKQDNFDVIKANYRRLIKQYHYDSIASKNLPEDVVKFSEQKTQSLNEAYAAIKNVRIKKL